MESCKSEVRIGETKQSSLDDCFFVRCIDGMGHEGEHQGQVWVWGENEATGGLGLYKTITWK